MLYFYFLTLTVISETQSAPHDILKQEENDFATKISQNISSTTTKTLLFMRFVEDIIKNAKKQEIMDTKNLQNASLVEAPDTNETLGVVTSKLSISKYDNRLEEMKMPPVRNRAQNDMQKDFVSYEYEYLDSDNSTNSKDLFRVRIFKNCLPILF